MFGVKNWVSFLQDSFILEAIDGNKTKVKRITEFKGVIHIPVFSNNSFMVFFKTSTSLCI